LEKEKRNREIAHLETGFRISDDQFQASPRGEGFREIAD
jgi:hypothetical protein